MAEDHFYSSKVRIARAEEHLKDLNGLQTLDLSSTTVTGASLDNLKNLQALQTLSLEYTDLTDAGLQHLPAYHRQTSQVRPFPFDRELP